MNVIAHRGFAEEYPENSIKSVSNSSTTADCVEIDIRETKDGVFVVHHDASIDTESTELSINSRRLSTSGLDPEGESRPI